MTTTSPSLLTTSPATLPTELRILTLNCWGLKYISTHRTARLIQIGHDLAALIPIPQIICLQECWTQADYTSIRTSLSPSHPYSKYYHSGIFGGGLALLSAFPIESSSMHQYPLNGRPTAFFRGDWFVGKGVAAATLRIGPHEQDVLEMLNTHLHAPYEAEPNDSYICHRTAQAWEIAKLARGAREKGRLVIAVGDFNMVPGSLAHGIVETHGGVRDVWRVVRPEASLGAFDQRRQAHDEISDTRGVEVPSVEFNLRVNGTTCDSRANTWRMGKEVTARIKKGENVPVDWDGEDRRGKRLDYIFFSEAPVRYGESNGSRNGNGNESPTSQWRWTVQKAHVGMQTRHPTLQCSLSDHFSVEATLQLSPAPSSDLTASSPPSPPYLAINSYISIQSLIHGYTARENFQRRFRLWHFGASIFISLGCFIAIWWSPRNFASFILLLLSTLGFGAGLLDGLIGGLFVGSELRALREFEWEVANVRARAECAEREGSVNSGVGKEVERLGHMRQDGYMA